MQAVVDHLGRFRDHELGWPGSVNDSVVFKESDLWKLRDIYFGPDEYILVDKGRSVSLSVLFSILTWTLPCH